MKPVEAVIPWANGSDAQWLAERHRCEVPTRLCQESPARYRTWGLIDLCLSSILRNVDWVTRITIVTAGSGPPNLGTIQRINPTIPIRVVAEQDFVPSQYLPIFNAFCIESLLHLIPDLTEEFLLVNDDMYFEKPTAMQEYLTQDNRILYCDNRRRSDTFFCTDEERRRHGRWFNELTVAGLLRRARSRLGLTRRPVDLFGLAIERTKHLYLSRFPKENFQLIPHFPIIYRKQDLQLMSDTFHREFESCRQEKFRGPNAIDMQHLAFNYAVNRRLTDTTHKAQLFIPLRLNNKFMGEELALSREYAIVCINDEVDGLEAIPSELQNLVELFVKQRCDEFASS